VRLNSVRQPWRQRTADENLDAGKVPPRHVSPSPLRRPSQVSCPSCKTSFKVSDQFAGKQGPCPKCKTPIRIPKPEPTAATAAAKPDGKTDPKKPAAPPVEVKIHEPDAAGPKTSTGRSVIKPILRTETKVQAVPIVIIAGGTLLAFAAAWILRKPLAEGVGLRALGLTLLSPPLALGGYWFLQNDELEPYRGRSLWLRSILCAAVYAALWGGYLLLPADAATAAWNWIYLAPPFFIIGAGAAYFTLDLEIENAFFHYCFYVLVTLALGYVAHLHMPWQPAKPRPAARTTASSPDAMRKQNRGEIEWTSPRPLVKPFADCDGGVAARRTRIWQC
jgi:hypothetical protein